MSHKDEVYWDYLPPPAAQYGVELGPDNVVDVVDVVGVVDDVDDVDDVDFDGDGDVDVTDLANFADVILDALFA